jgi:hypothetical protein
VEGWRTYEQAAAALSSLQPEERLPTLIAQWTSEAELLSMEEVRKLFVAVWPESRRSFDDGSNDLLNMLRWIAPVRDIETYLSGTLTIFRAADNSLGASWTLDEAAAASAAHDGATTLFRATVEASDVLGHFTGDGSNEVLVDPRDLGSVSPVSPA